ncbi:hypothetical protein BAU15_00345 [Enterococcus sp. JM4C]|uniref:class A sortase n=1 Tax=Candidatus Enterococcus huntleyi TaxID=1857217 RepID=UPI001379C868|nr:class A sortase [Enterococcus sp. JM4C]KAF1299129.1 hypothetical protein BAU15_00345 [Enterococcus sp. JM4C]
MKIKPNKPSDKAARNTTILAFMLSLFLMASVLLIAFPYLRGVLIDSTRYTKRIVSVHSADYSIADEAEFTAIRSPKMADVLASYTQSETVEAVGKLTIPKIDLDLEILPELSNSNLLLGCVSLFPNRIPTKEDLVLIGHNLNYAHSFFERLAELNVGDMIQLGYDQKNYHFEVVKSYIVSEEEVSLLEDSGSGILRLITCDSVYETPNRLIIDAEIRPVSGKIEANEQDAVVTEGANLVSHQVKQEKTLQQKMLYRLSSKGALFLLGGIIVGLFGICFLIIKSVLKQGTR